ncbi:UNVERIFIED_CONTAM: hypothetical protein RMT77_012460 [Armadillidium vulgare]
MKNKYPEELAEENESLYMKLDNLQRIRNQLKNKLNALQNEENGKTYDWNLWKEQVIRLAELLKPIKPPTTKNTLSPFELLFERKKLGCQRSKSCPSVPPSDDRTLTIERTKETNYSPIPKNISSHFTLRPSSENSEIFQQEQHIPESVNKFSSKPQISATFKLSKLNLPTLKVPSFGLLFRNASSFVEKKIPSGSNEGERPKVRDSFHKGQVDDNRERQDVRGNKHNVAGNNVHSAVEETPPQRPVPEKRIEKEKCGIGKDLREEATKELPGKCLQQKNVFKSFLSSFTVLKGPPRKVDTQSFRESSNALKSPNFATEIRIEKETVNHEEEVRVPIEQRNKKVPQSVTRDLENENTEMEVTLQPSKYTGVVTEDGSKDDNVVEEDASENMEMTEGELTESHADSMELADFENNINKPNCNPEKEQNRDENKKEHVETVSNTTDEVEMEVSTSDTPEGNEVVMMPPTIHKQQQQQQQQQPQETFNSHFTFSLFDQQDDFMSSFTEKGTGFSLYGSPNHEQGENKNAKGNSTGSNFLFGTMESPSRSFSFNFQEGGEEDPTEEATTSRSSHDFFSLFSSSSTDQNIQSSQPSFSLF